MVDLLITLAQGLCLAGLIYGAYLSITYSEADHRKVRARRTSRRPWQAVAPTRPESSDRRTEERHVRA
jgi:hypothetical protein